MRGLHLPQCSLHVFTSEPIESISMKFSIGQCIYFVLAQYV